MPKSILLEAIKVKKGTGKKRKLGQASKVHILHSHIFVSPFFLHSPFTITNEAFYKFHPIKVIFLKLINKPSI